MVLDSTGGALKSDEQSVVSQNHSTPSCGDTRIWYCWESFQIEKNTGSKISNLVLFFEFLIVRTAHIIKLIICKMHFEVNIILYQ